MKSFLYAGIMVLFLGCSEDPVKPPQQFDPVHIQIGGEWAIRFETGVQWRLSLQQDSLSIQGFVQPDTTLQLFMEIEGRIEKGGPDFHFEGRSWFYFHEFRCYMRGESVFDGGMKLFDVETNELIRDFWFSATKRPDREIEFPRSLPAYPQLLSEESGRRPHRFVPSGFPLR